MSMSFVALYRGKTISDARLVATCVDPAIIKLVTQNILGAVERDAADGDPVIREIASGRRKALRLIQKEKRHADV